VIAVVTQDHGDFQQFIAHKIMVSVLSTIQWFSCSSLL